MPASKEQQRKAAERREHALRLRISGLTYEAIARQLRSNDFPRYDSAAAFRDVKQALAERQVALDGEADRFIVIEAARLDNWTRLLETRLVLAQQSNDEHVIGMSVDRLLRISQRRGKLLGLDQDVTNKPAAEDELDKRRQMREKRVGHDKRRSG
jgi:hypothetical protein